MFCFSIDVDVPARLQSRRSSFRARALCSIAQILGHDGAGDEIGRLVTSVRRDGRKGGEMKRVCCPCRCSTSCSTLWTHVSVGKPRAALCPAVRRCRSSHTVGSLYPVCASCEWLYEAGHVSRPHESPPLSAHLLLNALIWSRLVKSR